jgi:N-acetylneuraminate synthase
MIQIAGRAIGRGQPVYLVAEMSANHHGDLERAKALVRAAARAGADAVKLQTSTPDTMTIDSDAPLFKLGADSTWGGRTLYELYQEAYTPWEWHAPLQAVAADEGIELFSTPFDETAVAFLESLGMPAYKIASFELVDTPLLTRVAKTGKPVIISTGMASMEEIREAVSTLRGAGCTELVVLRCASAYPADPADVHLALMRRLASDLDVETGLSDHCMDPVVSVAATAMGAVLIEKHFILDRNAGGPDSSFSLEPSEFAELVRQVRMAERAVGSADAVPGPSASERGNAALRRSLFVVADIEPGAAFTSENVRAIRPGAGLPPKHLGSVLGRRAAKAIKRGTPLAWDLIAS